MNASEEAFGIIPARKKENGWELFLILHRKGLHWAFPKGHRLEGESNLQAAERELEEETGLKVTKLLREAPFQEQYRFCREDVCVDKKNFYFLALVSGEVVLQTEEILEGRWISISESLKLVTFPQAFQICQEVLTFFNAFPFIS
jgi:bis(5'-nucleosidyl)-tetraphosphatase